MGSNHLNDLFGKGSNNKNQLDELNEYLIKVAYTKAGIRRKLVLIQKYIDKIKQSKPLK